MSDAFERALAKTFEHEGDYADIPADKGGKTRYGVTEAVARRHGYTGDMRDYPWEHAKRVYRADYWERPRFDAIAALSEPVAAKLFDVGVNMGPSVATRFLQRLLNALNRSASDFADVAVDGAVGPATLAALGSFLRFRGAAGAVALMNGLRGLQAARYIELAEADKTQETFVLGWLTRAGQ